MSLERWVLDTNVLISAALIKGSVPATLLTHILVSHRLVFSADTFAELETRIWKPKFDRYITLEDRRLLLADLGGAADWMVVDPVHAARAYSRDRDDDKFVHLALTAGAPWLVSGDADLLSLQQIDTTRVLTPAEALQRSAPPA
jgi:uncharacterized protein